MRLSPLVFTDSLRASSGADSGKFLTATSAFSFFFERTFAMDEEKGSTSVISCHLPGRSGFADEEKYRWVF